jgi:hypothetical protein
MKNKKSLIISDLRFVEVLQSSNELIYKDMG